MSNQVVIQLLLILCLLSFVATEKLSTISFKGRRESEKTHSWPMSKVFALSRGQGVLLLIWGGTNI